MIENKCKHNGWQNKKLDAKSVVNPVISWFELFENEKACTDRSNKKILKKNLFSFTLLK